MPYIVLGYVSRLPSLIPLEFKTHYETIHLPLLQSLLGDIFPKIHSRRYIQRTQTAEGGTTSYPASILAGQQEDFQYDAMLELVFEDQAHFGRYAMKCAEEDIKKKLEDDDKLFLDITKMKAVVLGSVEEGL